MAKQQLDASLDAFDQLIARYEESTGPDTGPVQPRTRREARMLREAQEAAIAGLAGTTASARQTPSTTGSLEQQLPAPLAAVSAATEQPIPSAVPDAFTQPGTRRASRAHLRSHAASGTARRRQRSASALDWTPTTEHTASAAPAGPRRRGRTTAASMAALTLVPALMFAIPAEAAQSTIGQSAPAAVQHATAQQILDVADSSQQPSIDQVNYVAAQLASLVADKGGEDAKLQAPAIAAALQVGGARQKIVETALSYLGTPYVLDGASYSGIDCSGLTMRAYQAVGIQLAHYVPTQDHVGTRITQAQAQPGDLVVFNNEDHIGVYLGGGQVLHAPERGRPVQISSVSSWLGVGIHFTRILPAGQ